MGVHPRSLIVSSLVYGIKCSKNWGLSNVGGLGWKGDGANWSAFDFHSKFPNARFYSNLVNLFLFLAGIIFGLITFAKRKR